MSELFKTVLILSLFGFGITLLLLALKPITAKKFPARWQYCVWIAVLLCMLIPAYKLIPKSEAQKLSPLPQIEAVPQTPVPVQENPQQTTEEQIQLEEREVTLTPKFSIRLLDLVAYIWFSGMCIYLLIVIGSYVFYLVHKHKNAVTITQNAVLCEAKNELGIKRNIRIRMSEEIQSPILVGALFPIIYIPCREIPNENMRMIFLHELTHYKRRDLLIKWLAIFVNAVHWFNPLAYLLCANVGEACEVSCDMAVTKNMSEQEQKVYMKTILDLVE